MEPSTRVSALVDQVRSQARESGTEALRRAFASVLAGLQIPPEELGAWTDGVDVLGAAYERLLTASERRGLGQFYTPFWAGRLMAGWLFAKPRRLLLDPGCGSGALSIEAARHPRRGAAEIVGLDIDPLAVAMGEANRKLHTIGNLQLERADFLLDQLAVRPDAVTCNPPYSRHHAIPAPAKAAIHDGLAERLGLRLSRLAALHVLFLARALEVTSDDARLAFITPSDWLDVNYGYAMKEHLLERAQIEALIFFEPDTVFGRGVRADAVITLIRKGENGPTRTIRLGSSLPAAEDVLAALTGRGPLASDEVVLSPDAKWARPTARRRTRGLRLADVARVRRGVATGANGFFVLTEEERRELRLRRRDLKPCVISPKVVVGNEITDAVIAELPDHVPRWLVDCDDPKAIEAETAFGRYLRKGRDLGIPSGYLASQRRLWYAQERRGPSEILFSYFNRDRPRFVRNRAGAVALNTWLIVEPHEGVDADELHRALCRPVVSDELLTRRRSYGGRLWKLEPGELAEVRLPVGAIRTTKPQARRYDEGVRTAVGQTPRADRR